MQCDLCPHECQIDEGSAGLCGVRECHAGKITLRVYGFTTGLAVDPIEKKPLNHFYPGSKVLSFGTIGCNLSCRFCQNHNTARSGDFRLLSTQATPEKIVEYARKMDCRSVAFTYNEPIAWAEYAVDTAKAAHAGGLKTVVVTNGYIGDKRRAEFFGVMDAANVDLKSIRNEFYRKYCSATVEPVLETLRYLARKPEFLLEVTNLIIPTLNDSEEEITELAGWVRKNLGAETPLHFSAFRPAFELQNLPSTTPQTLFKAREIALAAGLTYVYTGNIDDPAGQTTYCPQCHQAVISRHRFQVDELNLGEDGCCGFCGQSIRGCFDDPFDRDEPVE